MDRDRIVSDCRKLLAAYQSGKLGYMKMPEDCSPSFTDAERETRLVYFTLPMSLNYQRDSYKLWEGVQKSYQDAEARTLFDVDVSANMDEAQLRSLLLRYKIALQPNKHIATWQNVAKTISENWGTIGGMLEAVDYDFLKLRDAVQVRYKK